MGPETPLRLAGPGDVAAVSRLIADFRDFLEAEKPVTAEIEVAVSELIEDRSTEYLLASEPEVGFAQLRYRLSVWTGTEDCWLEDLFVRGSERGKGIGALLARAAVERARSRGCGRIQLETNQANEPAVALYESLGFSASHLPDRWGSEPDLCMTLGLG
jgi:GNAT superfamily N-acetyltransferase